LKMVQKRIAISMGIEEIIANKQRANVWGELFCLLLYTQ
jgi:hypothetical protein